MDETSPRSVMVGVDASLRSRAAVGYGAWEARTRRRPLRLVHVTEPYLPFTEGPGAPYATDEDVSAGLALLAEALRDIEGDYPDLDVSTSVVVGEPVRVLIREAAHAELLVVGSRHSGRLAR